MGKNCSARARALGLISALGVISGLALVAAPPASAATVASHVNLRPCVNTADGKCAPVGTTGSSGLSKLRCWRDGSWATGGYRSNRWFLVVLNDGQEGYVHSSFVGQQYRTPNCGTLPYVRAADWAISQIGQTHAPADLAARYHDWVPGPHAEWSGDCAKLTYMAFKDAAGVAFETGDAIVQYQKYRDSGRIHGGLPRYGDPVFYDTARPYGHTAIYIGGRTVVSTVGMDGANKPVERRDIYSFPNYLGWALV